MSTFLLKILLSKRYIKNPSKIIPSNKNLKLHHESRNDRCIINEKINIKTITSMLRVWKKPYPLNINLINPRISLLFHGPFKCLLSI